MFIFAVGFLTISAVVVAIGVGLMYIFTDKINAFDLWMEKTIQQAVRRIKHWKYLWKTKGKPVWMKCGNGSGTWGIMPEDEYLQQVNDPSNWRQVLGCPVMLVPRSHVYYFSVKPDKRAVGTQGQMDLFLDNVRVLEAKFLVPRANGAYGNDVAAAWDALPPQPDFATFCQQQGMGYLTAS